MYGKPGQAKSTQKIADRERLAASLCSGSFRRGCTMPSVRYRPDGARSVLRAAYGSSMIIAVTNAQAGWCPFSERATRPSEAKSQTKDSRDPSKVAAMTPVDCRYHMNQHHAISYV